MPLPAVAAALLPMLVTEVPRLAKIFAPGTPVPERNVQAATAVLDIATRALGASNTQEMVERVQGDPTAAQAVRQAVDQQWAVITDMIEAGGGGIGGARKADEARMSTVGPWYEALAKSHSFWMGVLLLPLVYMIVGSVIGLFGTAEWSPDVRASIAGLIVGTIVGGLMGYYFGQTTSRNRSNAPADDVVRP